MIYSLSQKAQKYKNKLLFDICLLRVKEPFIGPVNFARLPQMVIIVKGNHLIDQTYCTYRVFQPKRDVLNWSCDLGSEFLFFLLSLVWS